MATADDTLEILLNRATDPSMKEEDYDKINAFCEKVNSELEGPLLSTRLLAHKIQSPQEKEAVYALSTLEACVRNCGRYFHQEIGKFRFLNEMIKVVSPKYLGNRTTDNVKNRCIEILYSWQKGLTHEPKISDAYKMLKTQGIIKEDPAYIDKTFNPFPPPKPRKADFEDDEKAKTLERLLRSKNPDDLQAANRLIKNMVKEDMEKSEKRSKRINELESVQNQVKLLTEMISHYSAATTSKEEKEMMKEFFDNLEKQRPNLFRLASDTDENDNEGINDILQANDSVTRVMTIYKEKIEGEKPVGDYTSEAKDSSLLDLGLNLGGTSPMTTPISSSSALLENDFRNLGLGDVNELGSIFSNVQSPQQQQTTLLASTDSQSVGAPLQASSFSGSQLPTMFGQRGYAGMPSINAQNPSSVGFPSAPPAYSAISHSIRPTSPSAVGDSVFSAGPKPSVLPASSTLADLDILDRSLQDHQLSKESFPVKVAPVKLPLNQMVTNKTAAPVTNAAPVMVAVTSSPGSVEGKQVPPTSVNTRNGDFSPMVSAVIEPVPELLPLTDVFVPLETIKPAPDIPSVTAYEKNGLKVMLHFAKDRPRPDVIAMVVSTMSTNSQTITSFVFQAAVPKIMKVKLQPPSASDLPAYNIIIPPAAITQVMLVANPRKEKVRLKYKLSYTLDGKVISDMGDIENIPFQ